MDSPASKIIVPNFSTGGVVLQNVSPEKREFT